LIRKTGFFNENGKEETDLLRKYSRTKREKFLQSFLSHVEQLSDADIPEKDFSPRCTDHFRINMAKA
jgi:hypothetical protein